MRSILCLALFAAGMLAQRDLTAQAESSRTIQPEAWQLLQMANQARATTGAQPLKWDPALAAAARQHCLRMAAEGPISHRYAGEDDLSVRAGQAGAHFSMIEENVAMGPTVDSVHVGWMHSPGHRDNLLNPNVDRVGIAVVASRGELYAVADYEQSVKVLEQDEVEAVVGRLLRASGVSLREDRVDARAYCAEGKDAEITSQPGFLMMWQGPDLTRLPQKLVARLASGQYHEAAVGSCPTTDLGGSFTAYRVAVMLY